MLLFVCRFVVGGGRSFWCFIEGGGGGLALPDEGRGRGDAAAAAVVVAVVVPVLADTLLRLDSALVGGDPSTLTTRPASRGLRGTVDFLRVARGESWSAKPGLKGRCDPLGGDDERRDDDDAPPRPPGPPLPRPPPLAEVLRGDRVFVVVFRDSCGALLGTPFGSNTSPSELFEARLRRSATRCSLAEGPGPPPVRRLTSSRLARGGILLPRATGDPFTWTRIRPRSWAASKLVGLVPKLETSNASSLLPCDTAFFFFFFLLGGESPPSSPPPPWLLLLLLIFAAKFRTLAFIATSSFLDMLAFDFANAALHAEVA